MLISVKIINMGKVSGGFCTLLQIHFGCISFTASLPTMITFPQLLHITCSVDMAHIFIQLLVGFSAGSQSLCCLIGNGFWKKKKSLNCKLLLTEKTKFTNFAFFK